MGNDPVELAALDSQLEAVGGRSRYQEASQLSTSLFSTSRWVLARLTNVSLLQGVCAASLSPVPPPQTSKASPRRNLRLLEVGAINTQLLDAASKPGMRLSVRALYLRSTDPRIEAADFSALPVPEPPKHDALVCSMVLNCVPTAPERGRMLLL
ncbi:hypothetical protein TeGR_g7566, partial [Tetraparma gracilis]